MKKLILLLLFYSLSISGYMQNLNIEQCYALARQNYPLIKQYDLIEKSKTYNLAYAAGNGERLALVVADLRDFVTANLRGRMTAKRGHYILHPQGGTLMMDVKILAAHPILHIKRA